MNYSYSAPALAVQPAWGKQLPPLRKLAADTSSPRQHRSAGGEASKRGRQFFSFRPVSAQTDLVRRPKAREALQVQAPRSLEWSLQVQHAIIKTVKVKLDASSGAKSRTCAVDVWAEAGETSEAALQGKLVRCRGNLAPGISRIHVHWLGRSNASCLESEQHKSWRYVEEADESEGGDTSPTIRKITVAQAVLGLVAAIASLYGMLSIGLEAEDNGSGKLIKFYESMGFKVDKQRMSWVKGEDVPMLAPARLVSTFAPAEWLRSLVPPDFDPWGWLYQGIEQDQVQRILHHPDVPWHWTWRASWPAGSKVHARMQIDTRADKVSAEVKLSNRNDIELAFARGSIRFHTQSLRVLWIGRSKSKPVHPNVRGQRMYSAGEAEQSSAERITAAMAVLGALAALARWFGTTVVDITVTGDNSGKLLWYFANVGFTEPHNRTAADDAIPMSASCEALADRCCPQAWRLELPPDGEFGFLTAFVRNLNS